MKKHNTLNNKWKRAGVIGLLLLLFISIWQLWPSTPPAVASRPGVDYQLASALESYIQKCGIPKEKMSLSIYDATAQQSLYRLNDNQLMPPASCIKLLTGITALSRYGKEHKLKSRLMVQGYLSDYILYGDLILQADADPLVESVEPFVQSLRDLGIHTVYGQVRVQMQSTEPLELHASWSKYDMRPEHVPLLFRGRWVVKRHLENALQQAGIRVINSSPVQTHGAPMTLASVSHELQEICTPMLLYSNNVLAQSLWTYLNTKHPFYTESLTDFMKKELGILPIHLNVVDGCGLSPDNALTANLFITLLRYTLTKPELVAYLKEEALPLAGDEERSGSLHWRMAKTSAQGKVAAKTGTLNRKGATSLTGYAETASGHLLLFSILNQGLTKEEGRQFQDNICGILTK